MYYTTKEDVIEVDVINSEPTEDTDVFIKDNPVGSTEQEETKSESES